MKSRTTSLECMQLESAAMKTRSADLRSMANLVGSCAAGRLNDSRSSKMRTSRLGLPYSQILPFSPVPLHKGIGLGWTPRSSFVEEEAFPSVFLPAIQDGA